MSRPAAEFHQKRQLVPVADHETSTHHCRRERRGHGQDFHAEENPDRDAGPPPARSTVRNSTSPYTGDLERASGTFRARQVQPGILALTMVAEKLCGPDDEQKAAEGPGFPVGQHSSTRLRLTWSTRHWPAFKSSYMAECQANGN